MLIPRGERIRRMLARRALIVRAKTVVLPPNQYPHVAPPSPVRNGSRASYAKKKAKARQHRKDVRAVHQKERKRCAV